MILCLTSCGTTSTLTRLVMSPLSNLFNSWHVKLWTRTLLTRSWTPSRSLQETRLNCGVGGSGKGITLLQTLCLKCVGLHHSWRIAKGTACGSSWVLHPAYGPLFWSRRSGRSIGLHVLLHCPVWAEWALVTVSNSCTKMLVVLLDSCYCNCNELFFLLFVYKTVLKTVLMWCGQLGLYCFWFNYIDIHPTLS